MIRMRRLRARQRKPTKPIDSSASAVRHAFGSIARLLDETEPRSHNDIWRHLKGTFSRSVVERALAWGVKERELEADCGGRGTSRAYRRASTSLDSDDESESVTPTGQSTSTVPSVPTKKTAETRCLANENGVSQNPVTLFAVTPPVRTAPTLQEARCTIEERSARDEVRAPVDADRHRAVGGAHDDHDHRSAAPAGDAHCADPPPAAAVVENFPAAPPNCCGTGNLPCCALCPRSPTYWRLEAGVGVGVLPRCPRCGADELLPTTLANAPVICLVCSWGRGETPPPPRAAADPPPPSDTPSAPGLINAVDPLPGGPLMAGCGGPQPSPMRVIRTAVDQELKQSRGGRSAASSRSRP
jgi:hypothetical protein